jgi:hypothetical protein
MNIAVKRFLCDHIWSEMGDWIRTREAREIVAILLYGIEHRENFVYFAQKQECLKCGRKRIIEKRVCVL